MDLDHLVHRLAAHQEGVFSLAQARRLGFDRHAIDWRRRSGRWPLARRGVVRLPGAPPTWHSEVLAGWLVLGDRGAVARQSAAVLLGLEGVAVPGTPSFVVPRGSLAVVGGVRLHVTRALEPIDVVTVRRELPPAARSDRHLRTAGLVRHLRVTSAARTIIDLAPLVDDRALAALVDSACASGRSSPAFLARRLAALRVPGRAGTAKVEDALVDAGGHSVLERRFLRAVRLAGLPRPRCQAVHWSGGRFLARVDADFDPIPLVVEVAGRRGHSSDADRAKDAHRRNELQALGVTVLEYTYRRVVGDPEGVAAEVAAHLSRLAPSGPIRGR